MSPTGNRVVEQNGALVVGQSQNADIRVRHDLNGKYVVELISVTADGQSITSMDFYTTDTDSDALRVAVGLAGLSNNGNSELAFMTIEGDN